MPAFIVFEPSLIISKDARSLGPYVDLATATRAHHRAASSIAVGSEKSTAPGQMLRRHYWEVVDRETAERYWGIRPENLLAESGLKDVGPRCAYPTRHKRMVNPTDGFHKQQADIRHS